MAASTFKLCPFHRHFLNLAAATHQQTHTRSIQADYGLMAGSDKRLSGCLVSDTLAKVGDGNLVLLVVSDRVALITFAPPHNISRGHWSPRA